MIDIVENCTACEACVNICPHNALSLKRNMHGEERAFADIDRCVRCNLCKTVCPQLTPVKKKESTACYASFRNDEQLRADSSSGGTAAYFYERVLEMGGLICGVCFDLEMKANYIISDIEFFKGSKYVYASMKELYKNIENYLHLDRRILFIGLPCHVAGLLNFLDLKKIKRSKLITIDLLCHGTCPEVYFRDELSFLKKTKGIDEIFDVKFRSNRPKWNYSLVLLDKNINVKGRWSVDYQPYYYGFLQGITLNENCYSCQYANPARCSDITIGDFINLGNIPGFKDFNHNSKNNSIILCNTENGGHFLDSIIVKNEFTIERRSLEEGIKQGIGLQKPFPRHALRSKFIQYLDDGMTFSKAIRKTVKWNIFYNAYICRYVNFVCRRLKLPTLNYK